MLFQNDPQLAAGGGVGMQGISPEQMIGMQGGGQVQGISPEQMAMLQNAGGMVGVANGPIPQEWMANANMQAGPPPGPQGAPPPGPDAGGAPGFMDQLYERFNHPAIAAAMGAGGSLLAAADRGDSIGGAIRSGLGGAAGGFMGSAQRSAKLKKEDAQRKRLLAAIRGQYGDIANDSSLPSMSIYRAMLGTLGE